MDLANWMLMPIAIAGEERDEDYERAEAMLDEIGLEAPEPMVSGLSDLNLDPHPAKLAIETNPFIDLTAVSDLFKDAQRDAAVQRDWFVRVEDAFGRFTSLELETATDRSGARRNDRRGVFWLVGDGERVVYAWDGKRIVPASPHAVADGDSLVYNPDEEDLFIVSDAEERLYVFTLNRGGDSKE